MPTNTHTFALPLCPVIQSQSTLVRRTTFQKRKTQKSAAHFSRFLPVIVLGWAGLPWVPAPSAVSLWSPVLNPKLCGTSLWLGAGEGPSIPFWSTWSCKIPSHMAACLLIYILAWILLCNPMSDSSHSQLYYIFWLSWLPLLVWVGMAPWHGMNHLQALMQSL